MVGPLVGPGLHHRRRDLRRGERRRRRAGRAGAGTEPARRHRRAHPRRLRSRRDLSPAVRRHPPGRGRTRERRRASCWRRPAPASPRGSPPRPPCCCRLARSPGSRDFVALLLWRGYGGHLDSAETANVFLGHLLHAAGRRPGSRWPPPRSAGAAPSAAIVTLGFTVGAWALDFIAAGREAACSPASRRSPPRPPCAPSSMASCGSASSLVLILASLAGFAFAGALARSVPAVAVARVARRSPSCSSPLGCAALASSWRVRLGPRRGSAQLVPARRRGAAADDPPAGPRHRLPLPEDPRLTDLERNVLAKLRRVLPRLRRDLPARKAAPGCLKRPSITARSGTRWGSGGTSCARRSSRSCSPSSTSSPGRRRRPRAAIHPIPAIRWPRLRAARRFCSISSGRWPPAWRSSCFAAVGDRHAEISSDPFCHLRDCRRRARRCCLSPRRNPRRRLPPSVSISTRRKKAESPRSSSPWSATGRSRPTTARRCCWSTAASGRKGSRPAASPTRRAPSTARATRSSSTTSRLSPISPTPWRPGVDDFQNGEISLRFKLLGGALDQCAGILFNLKPNGDYLAVRFNGKEDNLVLWTFNNGKRQLRQKGRQGRPHPLRRVARDQDRRPRHPARGLPRRRAAPRLHPPGAGLRQGGRLVEDRQHQRVRGLCGDADGEVGALSQQNRTVGAALCGRPDSLQPKPPTQGGHIGPPLQNIHAPSNCATI